MSSSVWCKYPNEELSHVANVDVLARSVDPETRVMTSTRLLSCETAMPCWMAKMVGSSMGFVLEETTVDVENKSLVSRSQNLTMSSMMTIEEKCSYTEHPDNPEWTLLKQEFTVRAAGGCSMFGMASRVESFAVNRATANMDTGRAILNSIASDVRGIMDALHENAAML